MTASQFSRLRQQDLGPLAHSMAVAGMTAAISEWRRSGRPDSDLFPAMALACAAVAQTARDQGRLSITDWAAANAAAADPCSPLNTSPELPACIPHG